MVDRYKVVVGNVTATAHGAAHPEGEYVLWRDYEALRAEVEAHKRSRQIDANEARSREQELRAEVERLRAHIEANRPKHYWCDDSYYSCPKAPDDYGEVDASAECNCGADKKNAEIDALLRLSDPTDPSPASAPGNPPSPAPPPSAG